MPYETPDGSFLFSQGLNFFYYLRGYRKLLVICGTRNWSESAYIIESFRCLSALRNSRQLTSIFSGSQFLSLPLPLEEDVVEESPLVFLSSVIVLDEPVLAGRPSLDTSTDPPSPVGELGVGLERAPASSVDSEGSMRSCPSSRLEVSP